MKATTTVIVAGARGLGLTFALLAGGLVWAGPPVVYHQPNHYYGYSSGGRILADGPGSGWGFPNGNPDGYGWFDHGTALPLGGDRTGEYYFPRYLAVPPAQAFLQSYYNPYLTRGQRYVAFVGGGGAHPAGGAPTGSAETPVHPYQDTIGSGPRVRIPAFNGRIDAPPATAGAV